jgi:hypothetical protein
MKLDRKTYCTKFSLEMFICIYILSKGIKILGVLLGTSFFTSSFVQNALRKDVQHMDLLPKMGDVQVAFDTIKGEPMI